MPVFNKASVGLGLRREMISALQSRPLSSVDFFEIAPENWMNVGGKLALALRALSEKTTLFCHGLSLSLGAPTPLDINHVKDVKKFIDQYNVTVYSEHLSYNSDAHGHFYDLLPIPFTEETVLSVAQKIITVQDILERQIAIENISYYFTPPLSTLSEIDFMNAVLSEADCQILLDVNNIHVNSINQKYSARDFLKKVPSSRISYLHVAGYHQEKPDLLIDTHGSDVSDDVWVLLKETYKQHGVFPTLLERDFNIPAVEELEKELVKISDLQKSR